MPSSGRYRILLLANNDLLDSSGVSQSSLQSCIDIIQKFPAGIIELLILHPIGKRFEWSDLPSNMKGLAEMRTYGLAKGQDAYEVYGVSKDKGIIAVVRPDGYVGMLTPLSDAKSVEDYFRSCLINL